LAAANPLPNNQTKYPSNHFVTAISQDQNIVSRWGLGLLTHATVAHRTSNMLNMLAAKIWPSRS